MSTDYKSDFPDYLDIYVLRLFIIHMYRYSITQNCFFFETFPERLIEISRFLRYRSRTDFLFRSFAG